MISYRHHIVSLVAVFVALAIGIAVGGGPLGDRGAQPASSGADAGEPGLTLSDATFGDDFAAASSATLYDDGLRGHPVSLVSLPGAPGETLGALGDQIEAAGGTVTGTYDLLPAATDPGEKSLVDSLGRQLARQLDRAAITAGASTYVRLGQLLGLAVADTDLPQSKALSVRQSLVGAELVGSSPDVDRSPLVLVVLGDTVDPAILTGLLEGLATKTTGVVVAGDSAAATGSGDLAALRAAAVADQVATVDGVDSALGQVTAVLALIRSVTVPGGSFGASGSDGTVPLT